MDCPGTNTIAELVCRALDAAVAAEVEGHVADCASCRHMMAALAASSLGQISRVSLAATVPSAAPDPVPVRRGAHIGRYRVLELLGAGGMGIVYAAHDPELDRPVALKLLLPELAEDPAAARALLLAEAQAMARVRHPNLVAVHDVGTDGERVYIAMELIAGQTLRGWLSKPRDPAAVLDVLIAAGRGLAAAHAAGIVHRDFKPENVLCGRDGQVCVSDFGLALPAGVEPAHVAGTPAYMAPEQRAGAAPDPRADQYSYCVVIEEAMRPLPRWLARVCARGRAGDPAARWPSMAALLDELSRDRGRTRRRALGAGAAAAGVIAVVGATLAFGAQRAQPRPCRSAAAELAKIWSPQHKARVREAILATGVPFAADTWTRVERALDDHAARWVAMHTEACEATAVHHSQSPELLDRRMACLAGRRAELAAAVTALGEIDRDGMRDALRITGELPALAACADPAGLSALAPGPPAGDPRLEPLRADLARAAALERAGKLPSAIDAAQRAAASAAALGHGALEAEALYTLARARHGAGDIDGARAGYHRAITAAARSGHAAIEARSLAVLAVLAASAPDASFAREYAEHALAIVERRGAADPLLEATVRQAYARVLFGADHEAGLAQVEAGERRLAEAERTLPAAAVADARIEYLQIRADLELQSEDALAREAEVLAVAEAAYGPDHPRVAAVLAQMIEHAMNAERVDDARGYAERVARILAPYPGHDASLREIEARLATDPARRLELLAVVLRDTEAAAGRHSPRVASVLELIAESHLELGQHREGLVAIDRAIEIWDETYRGNFERLVTALVSKAQMHAALGEWAAAVPAGERALAIAKRSSVRGLVVTIAELMMAEVYFHEHRYADALAILEAQGPFLRTLFGDDPAIAALDFLEAAAAWELDRDRPAALRRARTAHRRYLTSPELDPAGLAQQREWLADK